MRHHFGDPSSGTLPYTSSALLEDHPSKGNKRLYLFAVQRDLFPPTCLGDTLLQRMRVIFVEPGNVTGFDPSDLMISALPPLPPPVRPASHASVEVSPRARHIQGEILRDDDGRLYEKNWTPPSPTSSVGLRTKWGSSRTRPRCGFSCGNCALARHGN